jgi:formyl-CoA transferase
MNATQAKSQGQADARAGAAAEAAAQATHSATNGVQNGEGVTGKTNPAASATGAAAAAQADVAPLAGIKVIDWTQVQSGPSCTQMLAWLGADVIKIEKVAGGDPTRSEMNDVEGSYSLYFLQLNANKRSLTLDMKSPHGVKILAALLKDADIFVENIGPGDVEKLGFGWDAVHALNPRCIMASLKGFNRGSRFEHVKAFEPVAQCAGGAASTTGWSSGPANVPTQSAAALGDSNSGMHLLIGILAALAQRERTGLGTYVYQSMQNATLNLCRVKLRDQLILDRLGRLTYYSCHPGYKWGRAVPRAENAEGGLVLGWCYRAKGWEDDPNAYVYIVIQQDPHGFELFCHALGFEDWLDNPKFSTPNARDENKAAIYERVEAYTMQYDKLTLTKTLGERGVPIGPVMDWWELEHDPDLNADGTLVEIDQQDARGTFKTIGVPFTLESFTPTYTRAPQLGEHNAQILTELGYSDAEIAQFEAQGVIGHNTGAAADLLE